MEAPGAENLDVASWRAQARSRLLAARAAVPLGERRRQDARLTDLLWFGFEPLAGLTIGFYWPMKAEFDARAAALRWRERGSRLALPVVAQKAAPLRFVEWWPDVETRPGVFGLPVPQDTAELAPDALLIPPIGFDARGYRLGYGGGYFDRTLASRSPQPLKIGVARELGRIETIHPQPHDIPMDFIVTEIGVHEVAATGLRLVEGLAEVAHLARRILERRRRAPQPPARQPGSAEGRFLNPDQIPARLPSIK